VWQALISKFYSDKRKKKGHMARIFSCWTVAVVEKQMS